jgi:serine/threonine protein kinase
VKFGIGDFGREVIDRSVSAASEINHPNVVPVLDGDPAGTIPFLVMPLLQGHSMRWHLEHDAEKPLPVVLWFVRQICQALQACHSIAWTHGDIKPDNVLVADNGHITLVDFGFAHRGIAAATEPFRGTPNYAAPELLANPSTRNPTTDIFAAGRLLWDWLSHAQTANESLLGPACEIVEWMAADSPDARPAADAAVKALLRLEIDSLGDHFGPKPVRRAA